MKKIFLLILIIIAIGFGFFLLSNNSEKILTKSETKILNDVETTQEVFKLENPSRLKISKLNVDTNIENVGTDEKGNMDVPKNPDNAAWYELGHKIGGDGSAVIAAHFDKPNGEPAIFYNLNKLTPGDKVEVEDKNGNKLIFEVEKSMAYPFNNFPLEMVFNSTDKSRLNLITCDGTWNKNERTYSNRLVVFTKLISIRE